MLHRSLALDVLRGLAILLVLGDHLEVPHPSGGAWGLVPFVSKTGWLGVELFFVLSGYLIGGLLLTEYQRYRELRPWRFLIRRGFKIYPLYFLFVGYLLLWPVVTGRSGLRDQWALLWPNLLFLQGYVGDNPAVHTWTLAVEEHFYVLLPFALVALAIKRRLHWLLPLCLVVVPFSLLGLRILAVGIHWPYADRMMVSHFRLDALLVGVGWRTLAVQHSLTFARLRTYRWWLLGLGLLAWAPLRWAPAPLLRTIGLSLASLGASAFLLAALHTHAADVGRLGSRLASGLGRIGLYSYGIYLWHITVMGISDRLIGVRLSAGLAPGAAWAVRVAVIVLSACFIGAILTRLVEWPLLRLRDHWYPSRTTATTSSLMADSQLPAEKAADTSGGLLPTPNLGAP